MNEDGKKYNAKGKVLPKTKREDAGKPGPSSSSNADVHSDSSDEHSEKCPICLLPFRKQQVGTPSACDHCFCLDCLLEWSKNINTCPVDRQSFTVIHVRDNLGGEVILFALINIFSILKSLLFNTAKFKNISASNVKNFTEIFYCL